MYQQQLPQHLLQTPLNQLPFLSTQISNQITKKQLDMRKLLMENINVGLEFHKKNNNLLEALEKTNKICKQLEKLTIIIQRDPIPIYRQQQIQQDTKNIEEKFKQALKHSNFDEVIKQYDSLSEQEKYSIIIANQLPVPSKNNIVKIISILKKIILNTKLQNETKVRVIDITLRVLIQKGLKLKLEHKAYQTNRNLKSYLLDITQLYQKSFNRTLKILFQSIGNVVELQEHISLMINKCLNRFQQNILDQLISLAISQEKAYYFLYGINVDQPLSSTLIILSRFYIEKKIKPDVIFETLGRITSFVYTQYEENQAIRDWIDNDITENPNLEFSIIQANKQILDGLFKDSKCEIIQNSSKVFNEIQKLFN